MYDKEYVGIADRITPGLNGSAARQEMLKAVKAHKKQLEPHHYETLVEESAISPEVIKERGYYSISDARQLREMGFTVHQTQTVNEDNPAMVIPYHRYDGSLWTWCIRPDSPVSLGDSKPAKYMMVKGGGNILDCHPRIIKDLADPGIPLFFTEGAKKADALISRGFSAINLSGVYGWRGANKHQGKTALTDFESIALNDREVILLFDSDVLTNPNVAKAVGRFENFLSSKGADVVVCVLPEQDGEKVGIDDWFIQGNTDDDLNALIDYYKAIPSTHEDVNKWTVEKLIKLYKEMDYSFKLNDMNEQIEANGVPINDTIVDILEGKLLDKKVPLKHAQKAMTTLADIYRYHPLKNYLSRLTWDGEDHLAKLAEHFEDEKGVFPVWLRKWLVGSVAKIFSDGQVDNYMLVLASAEQNLGKSYFAQWICPIQDYFLESPLNPDDKDTLIRLTSNWIWEVGELGSVTRRADREALKRIITMRTVTVRKSYGRFDTVKPAMVSFIGTLNLEGSGFLTDPSGNRRFVVAELNGINWDYAETIDVNQMWAQAKHIYDNRGDEKPWILDKVETEKRDDINDSHMMGEPLEDLLAENFEITGDIKDVLSASEILSCLAGDSGQTNRALDMRLGILLTQNGLKKERIMKNGIRSYYWRGIKNLHRGLDGLRDRLRSTM